MSPYLSSLGFAVSAGIGLALYIPAGKLSGAFGADKILKAAMAARLLAVAALFLLGFAKFSGQGWAASVAFCVVVLSWSFLSVSGTELTAQLAPSGKKEGGAMGMFNAATALSGVLGAILGGFIAAHWGYIAVPAVAITGVGLGLAAALPGFKMIERE